ncbi:MAG TPA: universal stress protein [Actinoplanes sp.]|nr:universal stress protein [Actinoplanes sp.]
MNTVDSWRAGQETRQHTREALHPTRYSEAVTRYLSAAAYLDVPRPAHRRGRAAQPPLKTTGLVVVGVDDSPDSYVALDHAAIEAELRGWDLLLLHVQHGGIGHQARDRGARLLESMTERVHTHSRTVAVNSRLLIGAPAVQLLRGAAKADLLVVGRRHGVTGAALRLTIGDRVAAQHNGPVLVVRVPGWPPGLEFPHRPMIAAVDDSPTSHAAVEFALAEARFRGSDLILLHAAGDATVPRDRVDTVAGVTVHHRLDGTDPVAAVVEASDRAAAVVVGRRGRITDTLLGSVSRSVLQHAHCPVFLVG